MECLRIYADESGESHLADIDIPLVPTTEFIPGLVPIHLSAPYAASSVRFVQAPPRMREFGWHVTPLRQLVVVLTAWIEIETSDGATRRCGPGDVVLAEDTFGKGHITRGPDEGGEFAMFVSVPDGLSGGPSAEGAKR